MNLFCFRGVVVLASTATYCYQYLDQCDKDAVRNGNCEMPIAVKLAASSNSNTMQFVDYKLCCNEISLKHFLQTHGRSPNCPTPVLMNSVSASQSFTNIIQAASDNFKHPCYLSLDTGMFGDNAFKN